MLKYYLIIIENKKPGLRHNPSCDLVILSLDSLLACYKGMRFVCESLCVITLHTYLHFCLMCLHLNILFLCCTFSSPFLLYPIDTIAKDLVNCYMCAKE